MPSTGKRPEGGSRRFGSRFRDHLRRMSFPPQFASRPSHLILIAHGDIRAGLRGGRVQVEQQLDGSLAVKFRQHGLTVGVGCMA